MIRSKKSCGQQVDLIRMGLSGLISTDIKLHPIIQQNNRLERSRLTLMGDNTWPGIWCFAINTQAELGKVPSVPGAQFGLHTY